MKTKTNNHQSLADNSEAVDLSTALLINGKSLEQQPVKHSSPVERKFKSEKEFNELVVDNSKVLFGLVVVTYIYENIINNICCNLNSKL